MHYDLYLCAKIGARRIMITTLQFKTLDDLYQFYNDRLFGSKLPECIVNMSRKGGSYGFFVPERWKGENMQRKIIHEISVNPDFMDRRIRNGIPHWFTTCAIYGNTNLVIQAEVVITTSSGQQR